MAAFGSNLELLEEKGQEIENGKQPVT